MARQVRQHSARRACAADPADTDPADTDPANTIVLLGRKTTVIGYSYRRRIQAV